VDGKTSKRSLRTPLLPWTSEPWHVSQESVLNIQRHWVECFKAGREPDTSGRDNLKTYALVEAAYESAASHQAVRPKL
jgi:D-apiose dehydrogenase